MCTQEEPLNLRLSLKSGYSGKNGGKLPILQSSTFKFIAQNRAIPRYPPTAKNTLVHFVFIPHRFSRKGLFMPRSTTPMTPYRSHMPWRYYDMINNRTCLHVDAWIRQDSHDNLYFVFVTSKGGHEHIETRVFRAGIIDGEPFMTPCNADWVGMMNRYCNNPWARKYAPWLDDIHRLYVAPTIRRQHVGFVGNPSVRLHYVWSDPAVDDPMEGITNMYAASARAERDRSMMRDPDAQRTPQPPMMPHKTPDRLDKRSRSIMRTLDKLLQGVGDPATRGRSGKQIKRE